MRFFLFFLSLFSLAHSQVIVRMTMDKPNYILGESITAVIQITNHAGRKLILGNEGNTPWLSFELSSQGRGITPARRMAYRTVAIEAGQTVARRIDLSASYGLGSTGNYMCQAFIKMPGYQGTVFNSNRCLFTVAHGLSLWSQRVGLPQHPGEVRQYDLVQFSANRFIELFARVSSSNRSHVIAVVPLGRMLNFRRPNGTLDKKNCLHALFQVQPNIFCHAIVTPEGERRSIDFIKRGAIGDPRLVTFANGEVKVAGAVPYDPQAEKAKRDAIHKATDRPSFFYKK